jgi:phospholipase D1/2
VSPPAIALHPAWPLLRDNRGEAGEFSPGAAPRPASRFAPGRNCCAVARAGRVGLVVDGEAYFRSFRLAAEAARRSISILAWDFNSKARLHFDDPSPHDPPAELGDFLNWLARHRPGLVVHILNWDYPMVFGTDREFPPHYGLGWEPHRRVRLAYDNTHPVGASHHQKIVVVDDALAFIGGFDLTVQRWDSRSHRPDDPRRAWAGKSYPPFHDMMMVMDGEVVRAMGRIVRARWLAATGQALPAPPRNPLAAPWPAGLAVRFRNVDVALARTLPPRDGEPPVAEVEALYLDMIAAARRHIYIENQYFTAGVLGEALAARLGEPDGPEIVVVVRLFSHGWLEEHTMHVLRARMVQRLRQADRHGHFHIYYPHVDGLEDKICIDLHSKLMIVDDEILRIGSANLCNRSMGMDSECDAALEARGDPLVASAIAAFRNELLAEHLDAGPAEVEAAVRRHAGLAAGIEALAVRSRCLRRLERQPDWPQAAVDFARVGDPDQPVTIEGLIEEFSPEAVLPDPEAPPSKSAPTEAGPRGVAGPSGDGPPPAAGTGPPLRRAAAKLLGLALGLLALAAMWHSTPLAAWANPEQIGAWARAFANQPWAPVVILLAYTPACVLMFPRPLITLAAVVAFGPAWGFVLAISGILLAALGTYLAGLGLPLETVHSLAGERLQHITETLRRRGLLAITALRLVPLAPFAVEGVVAAAIGIRLAPFMVGTLFGMLPGTLATTLFGDQLEAALEDPSRVNYGLLAAAVAVVVVLTLGVRHWLVFQHRLHAEGDHGQAHRRPR